MKSLREKLDKKEISATELCRNYFEKIKEKDNKINSFITLCEEEALNSAKIADERIISKNIMPFTGIPFSIKDNICTKDIKTTCASKMLSDFVPPYNATAAEKLLLQDSILLGKTNMDEFAMGSRSQNSYFGGVGNPHNPEFIAGGSSGGAAASVAAGFSPVALASDTGGSICQPAAFCGVTGLKPTYGTISRYGLIAFASSLDQIGVISTSAEDIGYTLNVIAGKDKRDATSSQRVVSDYLFEKDKSLKGIKIGLPKEFFSEEISDEIKQKVLFAAEYYKKSGCELVEVSLPSLEYAVSAYYIISSAEAASNLSRYDGIRYGLRSEFGEDYDSLIKENRKEGFGNEIKRRIMLGNYVLSFKYYDEYYKKALNVRKKIKKEYDEIFKTCDVILTPTTAKTACKIKDIQKNPAKIYADDICTVSVNLAGLPVISTACGYDKNDMPIGMSIIGRAFCEPEIIALAHNFEKSFRREEIK